MQTAHEFFIHELTDMLDAERKLVEALGQQAEESSRPELQKAFQAHQQQTQKQVARLEQCFQQLQQDAEQTECAGIRGLIEEHDNFTEEDPAEDILDIFNVAAATKVESYEICAYEALIGLAKQLEQTKVEKLLNQNLKEEQQTLKKMQGFLQKLKPQNLGMDDEEDQEEDVEDVVGEDEEEYAIAGDEEEGNASQNHSGAPSKRRDAKRAGSQGSKPKKGRAA